MNTEEEAELDIEDEDLLLVIAKVRRWKDDIERELQAIVELIDELRDRDNLRVGRLGNLDCRLARIESLLDNFAAGWDQDKDKFKDQSKNRWR